MAPQIIYLALTFAGLLLKAHLHGKERKGKHSIWYDLITTALILLLLWWGGFFDPFFNN